MDEENRDDEQLSPYAPVPDDLAALSADDLAGLITDYEETLASVQDSPASHVSADYPVAQLLDDTRVAYETLRALRVQRDAVESLTDADLAAFADLAAQAEGPQPAAQAEPVEAAADPDPVEPVAEPVVEEAVTAAAPTPPQPSLPVPAPERQIVARAPVNEFNPVSFVAGGNAPDMQAGQEFASLNEIAEAMIKRHNSLGDAAPGTREDYRIARADWKAEYPAERRLGLNHELNLETVEKVIDQNAIRQEFDRRRRMELDGALTASGGLCAPVTPYYGLQMISSAERPVQAALPSFLAERGGLRYARPAGLGTITTAVGDITAAEDGEGGTFATKTCQTITCPTFTETDVDIIYHCIKWSNLSSRTFPELVAQWTNLVMAAHARLAESNLLTGIDQAGDFVTAGALGLGASATLFSQHLAAANGLRSRNRMAPDAVLRLLMPWWAVDLIISDVIRTQFQRFDTDRQRVIALYRSFNIEPTFYIDGASGRAQVFGAQAGTGTLLPFPTYVMSYLFPEGSFLYLDGGALELGIVRDSVLNATNEFQVFGETFENVAFIGVESLTIKSTTCDSGTVSLPDSVTCPISY